MVEVPVWALTVSALGALMAWVFGMVAVQRLKSVRDKLNAERRRRFNAELKLEQWQTAAERNGSSG